MFLQKTSTVSQVENAPANKFIALNPELNGLEHISYNLVSSSLLPVDWESFYRYGYF